MQKVINLIFEEGLPRATSQQKGETIRRRADGSQYIHHYRKAKVQALRTELAYRLNRYAPAVPTAEPVRLIVFIGFDVKDKKLWGHYKTTRPDGDNYVKEIKDVMTEIGFWIDDAQVVDERIVRSYSEKGFITIQFQTLQQPRRFTP